MIGPKRRKQPWREQIGGVFVYRFPAPPEGNGFVGYLVEYGYSMMAAAILSLFVLFGPGFDVVHRHQSAGYLCLHRGIL